MAEHDAARSTQAGAGTASVAGARTTTHAFDANYWDQHWQDGDSGVAVLAGGRPVTLHDVVVRATRRP